MLLEDVGHVPLNDRAAFEEPHDGRDLVGRERCQHVRPQRCVMSENPVDDGPGRFGRFDPHLAPIVLVAQALYVAGRLEAIDHHGHRPRSQTALRCQLPGGDAAEAVDNVHATSVGTVDSQELTQGLVEDIGGRLIFPHCDGQPILWNRPHLP